MLFYAQLQQMDGKWNDKWVIMRRKWMKYMSISDEKMNNSMAQQKGRRMNPLPHRTRTRVKTNKGKGEIPPNKE